MAALVGSVSAQTFPCYASLRSSEEVPPSGTTASGRADLTYDISTKVLTYNVVVSGMTGTVAHIHDAVRGVNGGIVFPLAGGPTVWSGSTAALTAAQEAKLLSEGYYINVHSSAHPGGEVRGQILIPTNFFARLRGSNEVPPSGSTATAECTLRLNQPSWTIDYNVPTVGLVGGTVAHIHDAPAGVNGGIAHGLAGGPPTWSGTTAALTQAQILDLLTEGLYINVHTSANPGGEIRDQIHIGLLNANATRLSRAVGGTQNLFLTADDPAHAGHLYWMFGSISGTVPGIPTSGGLLPLVADTYFTYTLINPNKPPLLAGLGLLNAAADAEARFVLPPGTTIPIPLTVFHAYIVYDLGSGMTVYVSNPVSVDILP